MIYAFDLPDETSLMPEMWNFTWMEDDVEMFEDRMTVNITLEEDQMDLYNFTVNATNNMSDWNVMTFNLSVDKNPPTFHEILPAIDGQNISEDTMITMTLLGEDSRRLLSRRSRSLIFTIRR